MAPRPKSDQTDGADGNFSSHTLYLYCLRLKKKKDFLEILFKNKKKTRKFAEIEMFVNTFRLT